MNDLLKNQFIQALGLGAFVWLIMRAIGLGIGWFLLAMESFSRWYRYAALPAAEEIAIGAAIVYLLFAALISSQKS